MMRKRSRFSILLGVAIALAIVPCDAENYGDSTGIGLKWSIGMHEDPPVGMALDRGDVLILTHQGNVHRRKVASGEVIRSSELGIAPASPPLVNGQDLIVASADGSIRKINLVTGSLVWRSDSLGNRFSSLMMAKGCVYAGVGGAINGVVGLDLGTGAKILAVSLPSAVMSKPSLYGDIIWAGTVSGDVFGINRIHGAVFAAYRTPGEFYPQPVSIYRGKPVIAPTGDAREITMLNPGTNGTPVPLWTYSFHRNRYLDAIQMQDIAVLPPVSQAKVMAKTLALEGFAATQFDVSRDFMPSGPVHTSALTVHGNKIAAVVKEPGFPPQALYHVKLLDAATGAPVAQYECLMEGTPFSWCLAPAVNATSIQAVVGKATILSLNKGTGEIEWEYSLKDQTISDFVAAGQTLLVRTMSDSIFALETRRIPRLPSVLTLFPNSPNPFNRLTTIRFALPKAGHVRLRIFDLQGRSVASLIDENKLPGYYSLSWKGTNSRHRRVASGTYLMKLDVEGLTKTLPMAIVR